MALVSGLALPASAQSAGGGDSKAADDTSIFGMLKAPADPDAKMLVEADAVTYDMDAEKVTASGKVVIYYGSYVVVAESVAVDRTTKRVMAEGKVEITDPNGNVVRGDRIELTDDLRDGVAQAFELVTADRIAFRSRQATRSGGDTTVFEDGTYLPCVDCNGVKGRNPIWQIKANRIIHKQNEKTVVMENATFEFLGVPLAWVPMLSQPDPSVKQKTGFLVPNATYDKARGFSVSVPYYVSIAPDKGLTFSPAYYTRQGMLFDAEWRQRLENGQYSIGLSSIWQNDRSAFDGTSGDRVWRGSVTTTGRFRINDRWHWGWDGTVATDPSYLSDYDRKGGNNDVSVNRVFLTGIDGRNRFDLAGYGFFVQQEDDTSSDALAQDKDLQEKQPLVHPSLDHQVYAPGGLWGGDASLTTNFTSLSRLKSDVFQFDTNGDGVADGPSRLRGAAGTFDRLSIDAMWRRRFVDGIGQVFTPFLYLRGDAFYSDPTNGSGLPDDDHQAFLRAMPAAGLEYSYPIAVTSPVGTQVIEPVAQLIVRPSETEANYVPNEDAQSLVFDANSLFDYDKFSGYDRVEGGTRANIGLRYSGNFGHGINVTGLVGQSFQLAGQNSFAMATEYDTSLYSGLEHDVSDYVAGLTVNTDKGLLAGANIRLDPDTFATNRLQAQVLGITGPMTAAVTYAFIRAQPDLGITDDRSEVQGAVSFRVNEYWRLFGSTRYDLINDDFVRHAVGIAYDSEEFSLSLSYSNDFTTSPSDQTVYLKAAFRTLGSTNTSVGLNN